MKKPYKIIYYTSTDEFVHKANADIFDEELTTIEEAEMTLKKSEKNGSIVRATYRVIVSFLPTFKPQDFSEHFKIRFTDDNLPCGCEFCREKKRQVH